jgi:hypothetical protein
MNPSVNKIKSTDRRDFLKVSLGLAFVILGQYLNDVARFSRGIRGLECLCGY